MKKNDPLPTKDVCVLNLIEKSGREVKNLTDAALVGNHL